MPEQRLHFVYDVTTFTEMRLHNGPALLCLKREDRVPLKTCMLRYMNPPWTQSVKIKLKWKIDNVPLIINVQID